MNIFEAAGRGVLCVVYILLIYSFAGILLHNQINCPISQFQLFLGLSFIFSTVLNYSLNKNKDVK